MFCNIDFVMGELVSVAKELEEYGYPYYVYWIELYCISYNIYLK